MSSNRNTLIGSLHDVVLGAKLAKIAGDDTCTGGGTTSSEATPEDVAAIQQRLRILQWATPALTGDHRARRPAVRAAAPSGAGPRWLKNAS